MKISFSNVDQLKSINYFLRTNDLSDSSKLEICAEKSWIYVHPVCLAFAAALASEVGKENTTIDIGVPRAAMYLDRMGLYDYSSSNCPIEYNQHEETGRFIPITQLKTEQEQSRFIADLHPILHLSPEKSETVKYVLGELIRNVIEHSNAQNGAFVAVQYTAEKNKLSVGICDTGVGLRASLEKYHNPVDDLDAIRLALMPGVSGTAYRGGTGDNAGAGLYIVKSIVKTTRNYFLVYSGSAAYKLHKFDKRVKYSPRLNENPFADKCAVYDDLPNFGGTLIGLDLTLTDTETFSEILERIKVSYSKAIRERKKAKYKEVKFV
ncbi:ATP-binding protein [Candidatus Saccharibacteria bacterium]|nr:ATP-binding protein [Candidatus Saccharibacteria bacterium]